MKKHDLKRTSITDVNGATFFMRGHEDLNKAMYNRKITVRITGDEQGISLSLADEQLGIMFVIPVEPVQSRLYDVIRKWGK